MIKPIPRRKLPHIATYKAYSGNLGEGDTYSNATQLQYIKIEERKQLNVTNNGREVIGNAIMFYDYANSKGLTNKPVVNSEITFNSRVYHVIDTDILYGDSAIPHHYEILLK
jgi:hypothetical protein